MPYCFQWRMAHAIAAVFLIAILQTIQGSQVSTDVDKPVGRLCAWLYNSVEQAPYTVHQVADDEGDGEGAEEERGVTDDGQAFVRCASNACYSFWHVDYSTNSSGVVVFNSQGCWAVSGKEDCDKAYCATDKKPPKALVNTKFCCCAGDYCNVNVSDMYVPENDPLIVPPVDTPYLGRSASQYQSWVLAFAGVCLLVLVAAIATAGYRLWRDGLAGRKPSPDHLAHLVEGGAQESYSSDHLKLAAVVGQGRYGSVWIGHVRDQEVAVKIFPSHYRNYFLNERDIYCLPFMENPALLTYFGCDERVGPDGNSEYLLVLSYAPHGCLQDYLRANTIDCATFCKMALGVAKGLAHLHTDVRKGDKNKPCVSHRDLNTRNILVKHDLSCCLCDLGFAMKISGSKYYYNGEEQHAETKSINDVGTLRYMAPEVLEGAVNLRDCESSLKQIDVYALGLVLWELASRCCDFYQGGQQQTPAFTLPFEAEVGHHPSFEQMQVLVSRHKARPLFPEAWKDWTAIKLLRETVEDCWDQDAEARLTALCVEERLQEMPSLWERKRAAPYATGVSPTVNPTQPTARLIENTENTAGSLSGSVNKEMQDSTVSEGTVETILTLSPSEANPEPPYKISNHTIGGNYRPLSTTLQQPYQGRNPCLERNLMIQPRSEEDLTTSNLIDRSFKHATPHNQSHFNGTPVESQQLVSHDYLNMHQSLRPATPIPYVQNVCDPNVLPKQPNIPGNGSSPRNNARWSIGSGIKRFFHRNRLFGRDRDESAYVHAADDEAKSNLIVRSPTDENKPPVIVDTQVCVPNKNGKSVVTSVMSNGNGFVVADDDKIEKSKRPSTLTLKAAKPSSGQLEMRTSRQSLDEQFFANSTSRLLKDINSRVKTPGDVPPSVRKARGKRTAARFSLYDDRMMTSAGDYPDSLTDLTISCSVPTDIDISCSVPTDIDISCVQANNRTAKNGDVVLTIEKDSSSF